MKPIYFIADAHLGSRVIAHARTQERRLVRFLDSIKDKAGAVYMLGDMFDFWYEYTTVVPRGYTRFLGKISELTDLGVEVHYFTGNHDIWCYSYLEQECGVIMHREPLTIELADQVFFLAHDPKHIPQPLLPDSILCPSSALGNRIRTALGCQQPPQARAYGRRTSLSR